MIIYDKTTREQDRTKQEEQEQEEPKILGWNSVPNPTDITPNSETITAVTREEPLTQQERDEKYKREQEEIKKWG